MPSDDIHLNRLKIEGQSWRAENDSTDSPLVMDCFLEREKSECAHHPHLNLFIPAPHCSRLDLEPVDEIVMVLIAHHDVIPLPHLPLYHKAHFTSLV